MLHNDNLFLNLLLSDDNFSSWEGLNKEHFFLFFRMTDDISPQEKTSQNHGLFNSILYYQKNNENWKKTKDEKIKRWDISNG